MRTAASGTDMTTITVTAPAKINLYLHVTGRRADGYHLLDSLVVFADFGDRIEVRPAENLSLEVTGPFADAVPVGSDNLVLRAARLLAQTMEVRAGACIRLDKRLPVAAGIGGGSADAAATLQALQVLWRVDACGQTLAAMALSLGADVPVCLAGRPCVVSGVGDIVTPAPALPPCWLVLVNPGVPLPTPKVFALRDGPFSLPAPFPAPPADATTLAELLSKRRNDLTAAAIAAEPIVSEVLMTLGSLPGVLLARMSGSGATCFGLFAEETRAREAIGHLSAKRPAWWAVAAALCGQPATNEKSPGCFRS